MRPVTPAIESVPPTPEASVTAPRVLLIALIAYFVVATLLRVAAAPGLEDDESEQIVAAQVLAWGYGPQPPLFTWIEFGLQKVLGPSVLAIALLKNAVLFGVVLGTYVAARRFSRAHAAGVLACVFMVVSVEFIWESQRDRTHNVLALFFAVATLVVVADLMRERTTRGYVLLGACAGLGMLSKYSYGIFLGSLLLAFVADRSTRDLVCDRRMLLSLLIGLATALPHGIWAVRNPDLLLSSNYKFHDSTASEVAPLLAAMINTGNLALHWLVIAGPMLGVAIGVYWFNRHRPPPHGFEAGRPGRALLVRQLGFAVLLVLLGVIVFDVSAMKSRWLNPLCAGLPVLLALYLSGRLGPGWWRGMQRAATAVALVVLVVLPARFWILGALGKRTRPAAPIPALADQLAAAAPQVTTVFAENDWIAGNLRLRLPGIRFLAPEAPCIQPEKQGGVIGVWDMDQSSVMPQRLLKHLEEDGYEPNQISPEQVLEGDYLFVRDKKFRLGVVNLSRVDTDLKK